MAINRFDVTGEQMRSQMETKRILGNTRNKLRALELTENDLMECVTGVAVDAAQATYMQPENPLTQLIEGKGSGQMRPVLMGNWEPKQVIKEAAGGKSSLVWKIRHAKNGTLVEQTFRHEIVARTAAAILNETNSLTDPRYKRILDLMQKEDNVLREMRQCKKLLENSSSRSSIADARSKLDDQKLILAGIRATLGIK